MTKPPAEQLDNATPSPTRSGVPRWLVVVGIALFAAWLGFQIIGILTSPRPALAAHFLVFGNLYEITAIALFVAAYFVVRRLNRAADRRLSYLAVFASLAVVLNPTVLHIVFRATGLPWVARGDSEIRSLAVGAIALAAGIVALVRIRRSRGALTGMPLAIAGVIGGGLWVGFWILLFLAFAIGMSSWR
jgi:hypothetical protein